jgi:hypothetical protein
MPARAVSEWVSKYGASMDAVDWAAAGAEWSRMRSTFVSNYTGAPGLNPRIAAKYARKVNAASYRAPDVSKAKTNYGAKMTGGG